MIWINKILTWDRSFILESPQFAGEFINELALVHTSTILHVVDNIE